MSQRLTTELRLLFAAERDSGIPSRPVIQQLIAWEDARLPDSIPPAPEWREFAWPASGRVDFTDYWRAKDGGRVMKWAGPYL